MDYKITYKLKPFILQKPLCIARIMGVLTWRGSIKEFILLIKQFCILIVVVPQTFTSHKITYHCTQYMPICIHERAHINTNTVGINSLVTCIIPTQIFLKNGQKNLST